MQNLITNPKALAHERIDDWIGEAVGDGEPMAGQVGIKDEIKFTFGAKRNETITLKQLVHFDRGPADEIDQQYGEHHFDCLRVARDDGKIPNYSEIYENIK